MSPRPAFTIHPAAVEEAEQAVRWYRERSIRASQDFREEIDRAIVTILEAPHRWPAGPHGTRRFLLNRFPFALVYRSLPSVLQVVAVAHTHRRPGYWKARF
jgi:hypothetical protein